MGIASLSGFAASAALGARFFCALLFLVAAVQKLGDLSDFERAIGAYKLLPRWIAGTAARAIPAIEFSSAVLLLIGVAVADAALVIVALSLTFAGAAALNLVRGRVVDCGCHGSADARKISWRLVGTDLALAMVGAFAAIWSPAVLGAGGFLSHRGDALSMSTGVAVLLLVIILFVSQLLIGATARVRTASARLHAIAREERA